ncbi:MAG: hypothetical protein KC657_16250 [Myxococcales bacterium]|nr:hypothetical protein [Myxococcales bacterium]
MSMRSSQLVRKPQLTGMEIRVPSDGRTFAALGSLLTSEGVFVASYQTVSEGTEIILELSLADGPLHVEGTVSSVDTLPGSVGFYVTFDAIADRDRARLDGPRAQTG